MSTERPLAQRLQQALAAEDPAEGESLAWACRWLLDAFSSPKDPTTDHFAVATQSLGWAASERNPQGSDPRAREALEQAESRSRLAALILEQARLVAAAVLSGTGRTPPNKGFWWDEVLAETLEKIGPAGQETAAEVRRRSAQRHASGGLLLGPVPGELWRLWLLEESLVETPRWIHMLGRVLWLDVLRTRLAEERRKPPALPGSLFDQLARVQRPGGHLGEVEGTTALVDREGRHLADLHGDLRVAAVQLDALDTLVREGARMLGSLNAHRTIRWMVTTAHQRAIEGEPDARVLVIEGGWSALADLVGARSKKAANDIKAIIAALSSLDFPLPDGSTGDLLTRRDRPAVGHRQARVEITLGTALLPHYVHGLPRGNRALVPMPALPPLIGRERDHGAQAVLQLQVMAEFRRRARELATQEGVYLPFERWQELAAEAALPMGVLQPVIERWTRDGDDGPAFLTVTAPQRYTLAEAHEAIRSFLEEAGTLEMEGAEAGKRSVRRKRERLLGEPSE